MPTTQFNFTFDDFQTPGSMAAAIGRNQVNLTPSGDAKPLSTSRSKDPTPLSNITTWSYSDIMQGAATLKPTGATYDVFNQKTSNSLLEILTLAEGDDGTGAKGVLGINTLTDEEKKYAPYDIINAANMNQPKKVLNDVVGTATSDGGTGSALPTGSETKQVEGTGGKMITIVTIQSITVNQTIARQVDEMVTAIKKMGINIDGSAAYRSHADQIDLRKRHCNGNVWDKNAKCTPVTAVPGTSRHEDGLAIDFKENKGEVLRSGKLFHWLSAHAIEYGFANLPSEPWHWSTDGK